MRKLLLLPMALFCGCTLAMACPMKLPEGLSGVSVGEDMIVDGLPVSIVQVQGTQEAQATLQRVERDWREAGYDTRRHTAGEWLVVSAATDTCLTTLQLVDRHGATGYFSVSRPQKMEPALPKVLRALVASPLTVESALQSQDQGRAGFTAVLAADQSPTAARDTLVRRLTQEGWRSISVHRVSKPEQALRAERVTAQQGRRLVSIVIWDDEQRRTRAVLSLSDAL